MSVIKSKKNLRGVHLPEFKSTAGCASVEFKDTDLIKLHMQQHIGAPCTPTVKAGDTVKVGDIVGDSDSFVSAPIHSSCSGTVLGIRKYTTANGAKVDSVVIQNDYKYEFNESLKPPVVADRDSFLKTVRESGLVGLGGAGFPTHVKLAYKDIENVKSLIINGAECEPYITADYRELIENTANVLDGIIAVQKYLGIPQVYIAIEENKPDAIKLFDKLTANKNGISVVKLKKRYPQGAEKAIVYAVTGIKVMAGKLPADCGVMVMNVSTVGFIGGYLKDGIPLIKKRVTVDGDCIKKPGNYIVPIGTPINRLLNFCGIEDECKKILMGGLMMGITVSKDTVPIVKNNNAILAFADNTVQNKDITACIRCGRCISVCPMKLMPTRLEAAYKREDTEELEKLRVDLCINCGCCSYGCPAKRQLAQTNQLAKILLKNTKKA